MKTEVNYITDSHGVQQPAWRHEDGTLVSYWDNLEQLLISDEDGPQMIDHALAKDLGYEQ